jgi:protein-tyrosine phosphatase
VTFSILVLCTGNIGRSPLAEAILRSRLAAELGVGVSELPDHGVVVSSAGTRAPEWMGASARGIALAARWGVDMTGHRSTRVSPELVRQASIVYCMDLGQIRDLEAVDPAAAREVEMLDPSGAEIPDPRGRDDAFFLKVADRISAAIEVRLPGLLVRARERMGAPPGR